MPMYVYESDEGEELTVLRSFEDYNIPPTKEELEAEKLNTSEKVTWKRVMGGNVHTRRGASWGSGKGYWSRRSNI